MQVWPTLPGICSQVWELRTVLQSGHKCRCNHLPSEPSSVKGILGLCCCSHAIELQIHKACSIFVNKNMLHCTKLGTLILDIISNIQVKIRICLQCWVKHVFKQQEFCRCRHGHILSGNRKHRCPRN
uniref:Uncharacterized protein n=1 Tax=Zea mays TaxID=4577 RepID=C4J115_MAIZE|nr:unknown [Zea mays]